MSHRSKDFREDINGLRAIAVLCVVLFHLDAAGCSGGFIGVDVFFVISGYLMTAIIVRRLESSTFSLSDFYWARVRRIVPALLALLTVLLVAGAFFLLPSTYSALGALAATAMSFVSNILLWRQQGYFDGPSREKWLLHTWSLSVEWQFYVLFPIFLLLLWRIGRLRALKWGTPALFVASLGLSVVATPWKPEASFFLLPTRSWEMLAGGLAFLFPNLLRWKYGYVVGLGLIAASSVLMNDRLLYPYYWAAVPVLGAFLVIAAQAKIPGMNLRPVQWLGDVSYSLYLWHWPMIVGARYLGFDIDLQVSLVLLGLSLVASWLSYRWIEQSFRRGRWLEGPIFKPGLVASCAAVCLAGLGLVIAKGLPGRVPQLAAENDRLRGLTTYPGECVFKDGVCTLGKAREQKVFFIGDSHGAHLYPLVKRLSEETGGPQMLMLAEMGCLPIRGIGHVGSRGRCDAFNQLAYERAKQPDVETVVLAAFWRPYFDEDICKIEAGACRPIPKAEAFQWAQARLSEDVSTLVELGKQVIIVKPTPSYTHDIAKDLAEAAWGGPAVTMIKTRNEHRRENAQVFGLLESLSGSQVHFINPADVLCKSGRCDYQLDGVSLYCDASHLAPSASLMLMPLFEHVLEDQLGPLTSQIVEQ